ncbi:hypothetical protein [Arthrobacter sp. IK3]|uniref:hypothetical protein n=1 Tax=Arthrobacter sp. IK3 TaxID=3448169 RepID=UPI003EE2BD00
MRTIGSLSELKSLAAGSVISSPWQPSSIYQHDGNGIWSEPGTEETLPAEAVWELMTGSDSGIVLDEDRSVRVLYDAGKAVPKPGPANPEHRYLTVANAGRKERFIAHRTLSEARSAIEELCALPGGAPAHLAIRYRTEAATVFRGITPIQPETIPENLPWNQPA